MKCIDIWVAGNRSVLIPSWTWTECIVLGIYGISLNDVTISVMVSQISSDSTVYSVVSLGKNKQQSSRYWPFAKEIHRWPRNAFLCHDVIIPTLLVESMYIFVFQLPFLVNFFTEIYVTIIDEFQKTTMNCCVLTLIIYIVRRRVYSRSPVCGEFPAQRPVTRSFDIFFDLRLNKRLHKQSWGWWFETLSCPLWRQCNVFLLLGRHIQDMIQMWIYRLWSWKQFSTFKDN